MFVRERKNKSGSTSFQIVDKTGGKYCMVEHIGTGSTLQENKSLRQKAQTRILEIRESFQIPLISDDALTSQQVMSRLDHVSSVHIGYWDIFGNTFEDIGFDNVLRNDLFKLLVIARIAYPKSKRKTARWIQEKLDRTVSADKIYRFMDSLSFAVRENLSKVSYEYARSQLGDEINVVFFDATTLHYESFDEDDFRKLGFSKVGKFNQPQILIALIVTKDGLPVWYESFPGNKFEGHILLPVLRRFQHRNNIENIVVVADSGMLSKKNMDALNKEGYKYIVGARIKNKDGETKAHILNRDNYKDDVLVIKEGKTKLVVSYSQDRAKQDACNRDRSIQRIKKRLVSKSITKSMIGNQGARKFLKLDGDTRIHLDFDKIDQAKKWDGLKGVVTNDLKLSPKRILERYKDLWLVEKAFRVSKSDLLVRPIYHFKKERIKAHLAIVFAALTVSRVLEIKTGMSTEKIVENISSLEMFTMKDPELNMYHAYLKGENIVNKQIYNKLGLTMI